ncbi:MAG TPA: DUF3667 domain-containing protein [Steroidobacteraceae bacterium]
MPTAREFVHEFILHYFAAEGRLWRTLRALVFHPGKLTVEYLRGRKLAYVLPLRLYLTVSIVFFLLLKLAVEPAGERIASAVHRSLNDGHTVFTIANIGFGKAIRNADGSFTCDLPRWLCDRIKERVLEPTGELERRYSNVATAVVGHLSTAVFLLLPLFALYLQLAYRKRTYGEHFLFALHVHSFWFLVLLVLLLPMPGWIELLLKAYLFVYSVAALHAVYTSAWWKTVLKGLVVGLAYAASLSVATTLITVWAIVG